MGEPFLLKTLGSAPPEGLLLLDSLPAVQSLIKKGLIRKLGDGYNGFGRYALRVGWIRTSPRVCEVCGKPAAWEHLSLGFRCNTCPRPNK